MSKSIPRCVNPNLGNHYTNSNTNLAWQLTGLGESASWNIWKKFGGELRQELESYEHPKGLS